MIADTSTSPTASYWPFVVRVSATDTTITDVPQRIVVRNLPPPPAARCSQRTGGRGAAAPPAPAGAPRGTLARSGPAHPRRGRSFGVSESRQGATAMSADPPAEPDADTLSRAAIARCLRDPAYFARSRARTARVKRRAAIRKAFPVEPKP